MNFEFTLIRHGQTSSNISEKVPSAKADMIVELTEKGQEQAKETKELIKDDTFDAIFTSDMKRAQQTAELIFADKYKIQFDERLREGIVSTTEGEFFEYGTISKEEFIQMRLNGFETGETFEAQVARIKGFFDEMMTGKYGQKIAIVTHNGCLRTIHCIFHNKSLREALMMPMAKNCEVIRLNITKDENGITVK